MTSSLRPYVSSYFSNTNWQHQVALSYEKAFQEAIAQWKHGDAAGAVQKWFIHLMPMFGQSGDIAMKITSDQMGLNTAIRNMASDSYTNFENIIAKIQGLPSSAFTGTGSLPQSLLNMGTSFLKSLNQLSALLHSPSLAQMIGVSNIGNLQNFITNIKGGFSSGRNVASILFSAQKMAVHSGQITPGIFSNVTSQFNNMNQNLSGVNSTLMATAQYQNQTQQQLLAAWKSIGDDMNQLKSYMVSRSQGS